MANLELSWQTTDATFLEAILLATGGEGGVPLLDILLMADAIDGTVFSLVEVTQAVEKLAAAEIIQIQKNKFNLDPDFMRAYENLAEIGEEDLLQLLQTKQISFERINETREVLKKYKLKNYYQQYVEQYG
jgi:hypothetical protein